MYKTVGGSITEHVLTYALGVKDPFPRGLRAGVVIYKFLCAGCSACRTLAERLFGHQYAMEMFLPDQLHG